MKRSAIRPDTPEAFIGQTIEAASEAPSRRMMVMGFGAVGGAMRSRRRAVFSLS